MLFVCQCCNCIDDTENIYPTFKDVSKPNMTIEDMYGNTNENIDIRSCEDFHIKMADGDTDFIPLDYKYPDMIMMLCSECNTGEWKADFPKHVASKDLIEFSSNNLYSLLENLTLHDVDKLHRNFIG